MAERRRQIVFDLDTEALKKYYPLPSWNAAYDVIKRYLKKNDFTWIQGTTYNSMFPVSYARVQGILDELIEKYPWVNKCMRDCRETIIGRDHDLTSMFNKDADIPTRNELLIQKLQEKQEVPEFPPSPNADLTPKWQNRNCRRDYER